MIDKNDGGYNNDDNGIKDDDDDNNSNYIKSESLDDSITRIRRAK